MKTQSLLLALGILALEGSALAGPRPGGFDVTIIDACLKDVVPQLKSNTNFDKDQKLVFFRQPPDSPHFFLMFERGGRNLVEAHLIRFRANETPSCHIRSLRQAELIAPAEWKSRTQTAKDFSGSKCPAGKGLLDLATASDKTVLLEDMSKSLGSMGPVKYKQVLAVEQTGVGTQKLVEHWISTDGLCVTDTRELGPTVNLHEPFAGECDGTEDHGNYPCRLKQKGAPATQGSPQRSMAIGKALQSSQPPVPAIRREGTSAEGVPPAGFVRPGAQVQKPAN